MSLFQAVRERYVPRGEIKVLDADFDASYIYATEGVYADMKIAGYVLL